MIRLKTKITLINGETFVVEKSPKELMEETTNEFGGLYNGYVEVKENVWIVSGHILKIEIVDDKADKVGYEKDDPIVMFD